MDLQRKTILIIDDEATIGGMIQDYLKTLGFTAFYAENAEKGIEIFEKEKPSLILLDVLMPKIGGIECLIRIKKNYPEAIVVMATAVHDEKTAKQAIACGAYDYITKPIDFAYLRDNILSRVFSAEF